MPEPFNNYGEALQWLTTSTTGDRRLEERDYMVARAQVHATLAIVDAIDRLNETFEAETT